MSDKNCFARIWIGTGPALIENAVGGTLSVGVVVTPLGEAAAQSEHDWKGAGREFARKVLFDASTERRQ